MQEKNDAAVQEINDLKVRFDAYYDEGMKTAQAYISGKPPERTKTDDIDAMVVDFHAVLVSFMEKQAGEAKIMTEKIGRSVDNLRNGAAGIALFALVIIAVIGFRMNRAVTRPIGELTAYLKEFDKKDCNIRID